MPDTAASNAALEPVLTVTPNTALDRCLLVPDFSFGRTVVALDSVLAMAGKPADCSYVLAELGVPSVATGLAGGEPGQTMVRMLEEAGVTCSFLWVPGETRVNVVIIQQGTGHQGTVTVPSLRPSYEDGEHLAARVSSLLPGRRWLVLGGSPPAGVADDLYPRIITAAHEAGVRSLLDVGGKVLMASLAAKPTIVKPNEIELGAALGRTLSTVADVVAGARDLCATGIEVVVVTMGDNGSVCVTAEEAWHVPRLEVQALNTAGAGDAYGAGLLKGLLDGLPLAEALRWATACATSCVLNFGTAVCHRDQVLALLPRVAVTPIV